MKFEIIASDGHTSDGMESMCVLEDTPSNPAIRQQNGAAMSKIPVKPCR
jgi:hypothetical protein